MRSETSKIILDSVLYYISIVSECIISSMMALESLTIFTYDLHGLMRMLTTENIIGCIRMDFLWLLYDISFYLRLSVACWVINNDLLTGKRVLFI